MKTTAPTSAGQRRSYPRQPDGTSVLIFPLVPVITADPNLEIDRSEFPDLRMNLTVPERVTPFNMAYMHQLISNGPLEHPGAKYIIREDGNRIDLRYIKNKSDLGAEVRLDR
ncbi:hypothetical protein PINS_up020198 [Pythium insidiosum]|nr:hypothetical protein PINS_up020198 [Pythium insidiosum]